MITSPFYPHATVLRMMGTLRPFRPVGHDLVGISARALIRAHSHPLRSSDYGWFTALRVFDHAIKLPMVANMDARGFARWRMHGPWEVVR